jgi:hypothetical protein
MFHLSSEIQVPGHNWTNIMFLVRGGKVQCRHRIDGIDSVQLVRCWNVSFNPMLMLKQTPSLSLCQCRRPDIKPRQGKVHAPLVWPDATTPRPLRQHPLHALLVLLEPTTLRRARLRPPRVLRVRLEGKKRKNKELIFTTVLSRNHSQLFCCFSLYFLWFRYESSTGQSSCTSCVAGRYNAVTGSTTSTACSSCPSGT